jgi:hypothetical protein
MPQMQEEILKLFLFNKNIEKIDVVKPTGLITRFFAQGTLTKVELKSLTTLLKIVLKEKGFILLPSHHL